MSIIDNIVKSISPEKALKREVAKQQLKILNSGYSNHGASRVKKSLLGWNFRGGSTDDDITVNLDVLRQRSRDLYMGGAPLATGAIKTVRTNIVGFGLKLKSVIDADFLGMTDEEAGKFERHVEREFGLFADTIECDAERRNNFRELQGLVLLSYLMSGDCFALLPYFKRKNSIYGLKIRLLEADRICNPVPRPYDIDIAGGVEQDTNGEVVAFHVAQWHPLTILLNPATAKNKNKWVRVPYFGDKTGRRNIIHLMESERPEQRRGIPFIAPVIEALKQLGRYTEAELMAAVVSGMFTVFIKSQNPQEALLGQDVPRFEEVDSHNPNSYEMGNGAIIGLGENESVDIANPGRPNTAFDGFVIAVCRQIGAGLELPYELLVKNFTASYSASRAALLEAWKMFKMKRTWLVDDFCQPVFEEWFCEAVAIGRIQAPGFFDDPLIRKAYCGSEWHGPSQGQLDPFKEVKAAQLRVDEGFSTRARETAELTGGDFELNNRQRIKEEDMRRAGNLIPPVNDPQFNTDLMKSD